MKRFDPNFMRQRDWIVSHVLQPLLYLLALLASALAYVVRMEGHALATEARLGAGYSPASNLTSNLTQTQANYYDKNFVNTMATSPRNR